jgi:hypothetical protein
MAIQVGSQCRLKRIAVWSWMKEVFEDLPLRGLFLYQLISALLFVEITNAAHKVNQVCSTFWVVNKHIQEGVLDKCFNFIW